MDFKQAAIAIGAFVASALLLLGIRALTMRLLDRWCMRSHSTLNQVIASVVRVPSYIWIFCLALLVAARATALPARDATLVQQILSVACLLTIVIVVDKLANALIRRALVRSGSPMADSGLIRGVTAAGAYGVGGLMILSQLGVHIGPLLTALGVGGVAVALAFKDTAENMFSGIHLLIDRSVEVGDVIKIESGQEGLVKDIGWRTSKISLGEEGILIIPNTKLAQNITIRRKKKAAPKSNRQASLYRKLAR